MHSIVSKFFAIWTGYSERKEKLAEVTLLRKWAGLSPSDFTITDTPISAVRDDKIHCIAVAKGKKEAIVLLPGFGASGALYYRIMKELSEKYDLYFVDMRGMGCSGRPEFTARSHEEAEKYILEGIERWREKMGLERVVMCGHSLGGYMATRYAKHYPSRVSSLLLISPAGMWPKPSDFDLRVQNLIKDYGFIRKFIFKKVSAIWTPGKSPMELMRYCGPLSVLLLNTYVSLYPSLTKEEKRDVRKYLFQIVMKPGTGEYAMAYFLYPGGYGVNPLEKTLDEIKVPVSVYYGTRDWVAATVPPDMRLNNPMVKVRRIKDASHQICTDKPKELVEKMLEDLAARSEPVPSPSQNSPFKHQVKKLMNIFNVNNI